MAYRASLGIENQSLFLGSGSQDRNWKANGHETWCAALGTLVVPSLFKWWPSVDFGLFYNISKGLLDFYMAKRQNWVFSPPELKGCMGAYRIVTGSIVCLCWCCCHQHSSSDKRSSPWASCYFYYCFIEIHVFKANSVDPDHSVASDLGLHYLPIILFRVSRLKLVNFWKND